MAAIYRLLAVISIFAIVVGFVGVAAAQQRNIPSASPSGTSTKVNSVILAQAGGGNVNLDIVSNCDNGVATFKILNKGERWPKLGKLKLYKTIGGQTQEVAAREMRFAQGQKASFRMKKSGNTHVGLFVEPSWYDRPFQYDAEVICK